MSSHQIVGVIGLFVVIAIGSWAWSRVAVWAEPEPEEEAQIDDVDPYISALFNEIDEERL